MKKLFIVLLVSVFTISNINSQTKAEKRQLKKEKLKAKFNKTKALIESGTYEFEADRAFPLDNDVVRIGNSLSGGAGVFQGGSISLVGISNYLRVQKDSASVDMPFFGRAYSASNFGSRDNGIEYDGEMEDYEVKYNDKKNRIDIKFNAKARRDYFNFHLSVTASGNATLNVQSRNRQPISYNGKVSPYKEEDVE